MAHAATVVRIPVGRQRDDRWRDRRARHADRISTLFAVHADQGGGRGLRPAAFVSRASNRRDGILAGILTEKDCFRPMLNASYYQQWEGNVADFMTREVRSLPVRLDLVSAAEEFLARSHRVYPVLREASLVGLLHRSDLFAAILMLSEGGSTTAGSPAPR